LATRTRIPFIGLSGHGRERHPPIGSRRADDPRKLKRLIEDIVGTNLPVQNEIDQFGQAKSLWCTLQKVDQPGSNWALGFDLPDKEEPGSEVGGVAFMGGLAHLRCTFRRPWGAHAAFYPLPMVKRRQVADSLRFQTAVSVGFSVCPLAQLVAGRAPATNRPTNAARTAQPCHGAGRPHPQL
jgi:hypothetical protein